MIFMSKSLIKIIVTISIFPPKTKWSLPEEWKYRKRAVADGVQWNWNYWFLILVKENFIFFLIFSTGLFSINSQTGELKTAQQLTGKGRAESYGITIRAQDAGTPSLFTDVIVKVYIGDVISNDGVPSIIHPALGEVAYISEVSFSLYFYFPSKYQTRNEFFNVLYS